MTSYLFYNNEKVLSLLIGPFKLVTEHVRSVIIKQRGHHTDLEDLALSYM